ncbi:MAG TPA: DUF4301 family protein [Dysgonamonadaceae bacterium]|nr:DUF4301 family protein [Dysgonamonadaceae bacterium]
MAFTFSVEDKKQLQEKEISEKTIIGQLHYFEKGFPSLHILEPASVNKSILQIDESDQLRYISAWERYLGTDRKVTKFVPASGAASRMFMDLFSFLDSTSEEPTTDFEIDFFKNIRSFAFYDTLEQACIDTYKKDIGKLISENRHKDIVKLLLNEEGLNYGALPKGLLLFHKYSDYERTPMEEHLVEGALYAKDSKKNVSIHFTISPDHKELFTKLLEEKRDELEKSMNARFNISFSIQKPSTDTIAVDLENEPFRDEGKLLFRPGGHGALIENLNDLQSDIVFVKNIDNVVPDKFKEDEVKYKKMLAGVLVETQEQAFKYLDLLESGNYSTDDLSEIKEFIEQDLFTISENVSGDDKEQLVHYMIRKLNRPIRVCGMVRNVGEPGGGPFIVKNEDGSFSPQILEGSQIDTEEAQEIADKATHFNPVDLVCGIKNRDGEKFNLLDFVDKETGFISSKSKDGRALKALERPGLWNGAMSDWSTIFVEVPISTFNPVKTVNDLLRDEHQ